MNSLIVGRRPVLEALKAGTLIERIVLLPGVRGDIINDITLLAQQLKIPISLSNRQEFRTLASDVTTQGIVAVVAQRHSSTVEDILARAEGRHESGFIVVLDEIEDPHNLGALIRSAECCGAHGVVLPKHHSAPINAASIKAAAGATEHLPIAEVTNLSTTLDDLKRSGYWVVGLDMGGDKMYTEVDYRTPIIVVVGNEGKGIRRLVREHCDFVAHIPLFGKVDSLNASVAGALVMFEVVRQRKHLDPERRVG
jgi:23S rRNA (guanosine2251-2'-O)-methyltransferase